MSSRKELDKKGCPLIPRGGKCADLSVFAFSSPLHHFGSFKARVQTARACNLRSGVAGGQVPRLQKPLRTCKSNSPWALEGNGVRGEVADFRIAVSPEVFLLAIQPVTAGGFLSPCSAKLTSLQRDGFAL